MKSKYLKVFEDFKSFIEEIKINLDSNEGFILIKNRKLSKVKDFKNKAFLTLIKNENQETIEIAQKQALLGASIIDEMELEDNSGLFKSKKYRTYNNDIIIKIKEYEDHLQNSLKPFLEKL